MTTDLDFSRDGDTYLARQGGDVVSRVLFTLDNGVMSINSTVTAPRYRGSGYAGRLTRYALDDARSHGWRVIPHCPYTADWIDRHPDYADLLA